MDHPVRNTSQATDAGGIVQIALQWRDAARPKQAHTFRGRCQGHQAHSQALRRTQLGRCAQANVAATHDQDTLATKAGGQSAQRSLV
jgi:hypothetical protein